MTTKLTTLTALFLLLTLTPRAAAQRSAKAKASATAVKATPAELIESYQFDEAAKLLQKEISTAKRAGKATDLLENDLRQALLGVNMLRGTERVVIVDSLVVSRTDFLAAYRLSKDCGRIDRLERLIPGLGKGRVGETAYLNDFGDAVIFSAPDSAGLLKLHAADKLGNAWSTPRQLTGMGEAADIQDYPYMMADGVTLYYAAQGAESLGGYDIFVTRYNNATGEYVKAENVGMPFNSPANDYLMAIDETTNIGWFVTDRRQPADKVCIYRFIPNDTKEVYDLEAEGEERVRRLAMIAAVADSHTDAAALNDARTRLAAAEQAPTHSANQRLRLVIDDNTVYTSLNQFRNATARAEAAKALDSEAQLAEAEARLDNLRRQYAAKQSSDAARTILRLERETATLRTAINDAYKAMRRAELGQN